MFIIYAFNPEPCEIDDVFKDNFLTFSVLDTDFVKQMLIFIVYQHFMLLDYSQTIDLRSVILVRPDDRYDQPVCIQIYKSVPVNPNNLINKLNYWLIYDIWIKYQNRMWICRSLW